MFNPPFNGDKAWMFHLLLNSYKDRTVCIKTHWRVQVLHRLFLYICGYVSSHIPGHPESCIISFSLTCPKDELKNRHLLTPELLTWLTSASAVRWNHKRCPRRIFLYPFAPLLSYLIRYRLVLSFSALYSGRVNLFHMTLWEDHHGG